VKHDTLLSYLSEKGSGTWADLKEAWSWLSGASDDPADSASLVARDLAALGHIEMSWSPGGGSWCAAPPLLTLLPRSGGRAFVTGARTRHLYHRGAPEQEACGALCETIDALELYLDDVLQPGGPRTLVVACECEGDARRLAATLEIGYTYEVAAQVAGLLPPLPAYHKLWAAGEVPRGFDTEIFDTGMLRWIPVDEPSGDGLFRARRYGSHVHALHGPLGQFRAVREFAVYEVLRWEGRQVITFSEERNELTVPVNAALPPLHARAATLCSGRLPRLDRRNWTLTYANVSNGVAEQIATSLSQELQAPA